MTAPEALRAPPARAVHGHTAGATVVVLGPADPTTLDAVRQVCGTEPVGLDGATADILAQLAELAGQSETVPLVVVDGSLRLELPGLLDVLDRPALTTAALTVPGADVTLGRGLVARARVGADSRLLESASSSWHQVGGPTHALAGLLRVGAGDRAEAGRVWAAAAQWAAQGRHGGPARALDLATVALVRGGCSVRSAPLGPFTWQRSVAGAPGASGDGWAQRLRGASRGGDGFFSTYAVRPLSRRLTAVGLRHGWSPNGVTVVSLAVGVLSALLVATGSRWAWVAAAVLLMLALVVDCVDGEIARYTRRFSALGAWLDGVGDRVKEYSVFAALALVATRHGDPSWVLGIAAMALVTARHLEDYAYERRLGPSRQSRPARLDLDACEDGHPGAVALPTAPPPRAAAVYWAKKVIHMPIAERYLLIALGLLTFRPRLVLWAIVVTVTLALVWTQGGRTARVLLGRDPTWSAVQRPLRPGDLDAQVDPGPLGTLVGRLTTAPVVVGLAAPVLWLVAAVLVWQHHPGAAVVPVVVGLLLTAAGLRPPLHHRLAWQAPAAIWAVEALLVAAVVHSAPAAGGAAYAWLAAVAYHRYDVVYRLRDTGQVPPWWLGQVAVGAEGRILLLTVLTWLAPGSVTAVLWTGAALLTVVFSTESARGWVGWTARTRETT